MPPKWFIPEEIPRNKPINPAPHEYLHMGATVTMNMRLEGQAERWALIGVEAIDHVVLISHLRICD